MRYNERNDYLRSPYVTVCRWVVDVVIVIICALFVNQYIVSTAVNGSRAMEPTLADNDTVLVDKAIYKLSNIKRFDLVLYKDEAGTDWIKRVVGLPGETVQIRDGKLYIDGEQVDTSAYYESINVAGIASDEIVLGEGEYFLLGDWLEGSEDSRFADIGNIAETMIQGKVWFRISPVATLGPVS